MQKLDNVKNKNHFMSKVMILSLLASFLLFLTVVFIFIVSYIINKKTSINEELILPILQTFLLLFPIDGLLVFVLCSLLTKNKLIKKDGVEINKTVSLLGYSYSKYIVIDEGDILSSKGNVIKEVISLGKENENEIIDIIGSIASNINDESPIIYAIQQLSFIPLFNDKNISILGGAYFALYKDQKYVLGKNGSFKYRAEQFVKNKIEPYLIKGYEILLVGKYEYDKNNAEYEDFADVFGIIVLKNEVNQSITNTICYFQENGINIKLLSCDSAAKLSEQAKESGVNNGEKFISINPSTVINEELVHDYVVFGNLNEIDKQQIISILNKEGGVSSFSTNTKLITDCSITSDNNSKGDVILPSNGITFADIHKKAISYSNKVNNIFLLSIIKTMMIWTYSLHISILSLLNISYSFKPMVVGSIFTLLSLVVICFDEDESIKKKIDFSKAIFPSILSIISITSFFLLFWLQYNEKAYTGINDINTCLSMCGVLLMVTPSMFLLSLFSKINKRRFVILSLVVGLTIVTFILMMILSVSLNKMIIGFSFNLFNGQNNLTLAIALLLFVSFYFVCNYLIGNYQKGEDK